MAWTTPRTWVSGETVSATLMNAQIRDNLNLLAAYVDTATGKPNWYQTNYMTGDVTVNNSTVLVNMPNLSFTMLANEKWSFLVSVLCYTNTGGAGTVPSIKFGLTYPAGAAGRFGLPLGVSATVMDVIANTVIPYNWGSPCTYPITGTIVNGATPGTVQFKFAQGTAQATNTIVYTYSSIQAWRII